MRTKWRFGKNSATENAKAWLEAARRYVGKLDPLADPAATAKDLEPSDEFLEKAVAEHKAVETSRTKS